MILHFCPVATLPENTRPKAENLPSSDVGTILDTYIMRGASGSQFLMPTQATSSGGPSYSISALYFCAVTGEGKWMTIIWNIASPAGSQFLITHFIKGLPSISFSSCFRTSLTSLPSAVVSLPSSLSTWSFLKFMMASRTYMLNDLLLSSSLVFAHFLVFGLKKFSPHSFFIILSTSTPNLEAYISANCFRVKAQPCRPEPNPTEALLTSTLTTPMGPSSSA